MNLPPEAEFLAARGYFSFRTAKTGPSIAWTEWDRRHRQWAIYTLENLPDVLDNTQMMAVYRHELAHIVLNHFDPELMECHRQDRLIASDVAVNWFMDASVRKSINAVVGFKMVDPVEVLTDLGFSGEQYLPAHVVHNRLHELTNEALEQMGAACGGLRGEQIPDEDKARSSALASILASQIQANEEAREAYGGQRAGVGAGGMVLPQPAEPAPLWVRAVQEFARSIVRVSLNDRRTHARPQQVFRALGIHTPSIKPKWATQPDTVCLLVDTSGSMYSLLPQVQPAIDYLRQHGLTVRLIAGDVEVTIDQELKAGERMPDLVGGGGTSIVPLWERAWTYNTRAVVAFTDGYVDRFPDGKYEELPTLWVCAQPVPYGKSVDPS